MAGNRIPRAVLRLSVYDWRGMGLEMVQPRRRLWQSAAGQAVVGPCEALQVARDALVKDRTAALNRQQQGRHRLLKQQHKNRLAQLDRHLAAIDTAIGKRLAVDEGLARRPEILTSIPDVSRVTATGLLTQMPALGRLDAKAVASLAGLAPVTRQSGAWQGRSVIQGGRAPARRLLYMPALAATRSNPDLRATYRQLVAEGTPRKVAVVAVMRTRLVLANARLDQDRCWLPERPGRASAPFVAACDRGLRGGPGVATRGAVRRSP